MQDSSINQRSKNSIAVRIRTGNSFVKKNSCLVAGIFSFDTASLYLLTFRILEPYPLISVISH